MHFVPPAKCCNCTLESDSPYFEVVGVISGSNSQNTMSSAAFLNLFQVPIVGATTTSELLSNKISYSTFQRVVPSDQFQARTIIDIMLRFNWTYMSTIGNSGSYGEMGIKAVNSLAAKHGICIAYSYIISPSKKQEEFENIVKNLEKHDNAKVVVLFLHGSDGRAIMEVVKERNLLQKYIWISSDSVSPSGDLSGLEEVAAGGFFVQLYTTGAPGFSEYFSSISADDENPWLAELWERELGCQWGLNSSYGDEQFCESYKTIGDFPSYSPYNKTALLLDSVLTYAYAIRGLIDENCPSALNQADEVLLKDCVKPELLISYLRNVSFQGTGGLVQFDEQGDAEGKYLISQLQYDGSSYRVEKVGLWDKLKEELTLDDELYWNIKKAEGFRSSSQAPDSICSYPCNLGEFYIQQELKCCWECRKCRDNEIVIDNATSCEECPIYYWPEQVTFDTCIQIQPSYFRWSDAFPLLCLGLSILALVLCLMPYTLYIKHGQSKLIKATSKSLSLISLFGVTLSLITAIFQVEEPSPAVCYICRFGFNISFAIIYAPLLAKSSRIYRIFAAGKKQMKPPKFVDNRSMLIFSAVLIMLQVAVTILTTVMYPPLVSLRMPVITEKFVEKICDFPIEAILPPIAYNLLLIICCSIYAFKTRTLPENFNESRFIFFSVCTTVFLWIAFIPTYFTAFFASQKALLLALVLILNSVVILICMYFPKVYAVLYLDENKLKIAQFGTVTTASVLPAVTN